MVKFSSAADRKLYIVVDVHDCSTTRGTILTEDMCDIVKTIVVGAINKLPIHRDVEVEVADARFDDE